MEDALYMKRLHAPVFGKKPKKTSKDDWAIEHRIMCGFIRSCCLPQIWNKVNKEKNALTLWNMLEETFAKKSDNNKLYILMKLLHLVYVDGTSVFDHVNEFQGLADKLVGMCLNCDDELLGLWLLNSFPPWEKFWMSWSNSALNDVVSLTYENRGIDNEDMRRKTLGMCLSSLDALVIQNRGRGWFKG